MFPLSKGIGWKGLNFLGSWCDWAYLNPGDNCRQGFRPQASRNPEHTVAAKKLMQLMLLTPRPQSLGLQLLGRVHKKAQELPNSQSCCSAPRGIPLQGTICDEELRTALQGIFAWPDSTHDLRDEDLGLTFRYLIHHASGALHFVVEQRLEVVFVWCFELQHVLLHAACSACPESQTSPALLSPAALPRKVSPLGDLVVLRHGLRAAA